MELILTIIGFAISYFLGFQYGVKDGKYQEMRRFEDYLNNDKECHCGTGDMPHNK